MKKNIITLVAFFAITSLQAQNKPSQPIRSKSLGVHFFFNDFKSGRALDTSSIGTVWNNGIWNKPSKLTPGFAVALSKGITPLVDLKTTLSTSFLDYLFKNRVPYGNSDALLELDVTGNFKALNDNHTFIPYLSSGIAATFYKGNVGVVAPVGLGLQIGLSGETFIDIQTQMRFSLTDNTTNHLYHSIGISANLPKPEPKEPRPVRVPKPPVKKDSDNDGVADDVDECPLVAGKASLAGCPDRDNDGIADKNDNCPDQAGSPKYNGCPVPDSDGDGVTDEVDKCLTVAGTVRNGGCPEKDSDGDGINDIVDLCPDVKGVPENQGCPEKKEEIKEDIKKDVEFAAKNIWFETSSYKLRSASYKSLNDVVKILTDHPELSLSIDGHTDNKGDAGKNQTLSQNRADAVKAYLVKNGIDASRLTATGHGADEPVADNDTEAGRQENRRVELKLGN